jgi:predicted benzoate:H+ symporter BenE
MAHGVTVAATAAICMGDHDSETRAWEAAEVQGDVVQANAGR